jgi:hypothetical protein
MSTFRIRHAVAVIAATLLLASCNKSEQVAPAPNSPAVSEQQPPDAAPVPKPVPAPAGQKGADLLAAAGLTFEFGQEVLYDILDTSKNGTPRHRVLLEVLDGSFPDAVAEVGESLENAGCHRTSDSNNAGRVQQVFKCSENTTYYLLMQPAGMGPKLAHPGSVGSVHIMWTAI